MKTVASRLRNCRMHLGLTQAALAQRIEVSRSAVAQWESHDGSLPSTASFTQLAAALGCSFEWLATGRGPRSASSDASNDASAATAVDLRSFARDDAEEQLLGDFRELDEYDQETVTQLVQALRNKPKVRRREAA
jgi:transcriptional regulator with XRE-family HTH domain